MTRTDVLRDALDAALADASRADPSRDALGNVLIAGAGIGGLAAALTLAQRGFFSHVLERRAVFAEDGAGIQIGPNGTRILRALGVEDALRDRVGTPQWLVVHDGVTGAEITRLPLNASMEARFGAPYWVSRREDLHEALRRRAEAEPKICITCDAEVAAAGATAAASGVVLRDGRVLTGNIVVGADGLWSRVRRELGGEAGTPRPVGKAALRSVVPVQDFPEFLDDRNTHIWLAPHMHVVHYPVRGGTEVAIVAIVEDTFAGEDWSREADSAMLLTRFAGCRALREVLEAPRTWRKWPLMAMSGQLPRMAQGRLALLGDAAHPVLPFLAQGAVLAMEDAIVLAETLSSNRADSVAALRLYQQRRAGRARRVAAASRRNGTIYHLQGSAQRVRNTVLRMMPGHHLIKAYDWLYGWRP